MTKTRFLTLLFSVAAALLVANIRAGKIRISLESDPQRASRILGEATDHYVDHASDELGFDSGFVWAIVRANIAGAPQHPGDPWSEITPDAQAEIIREFATWDSMSDQRQREFAVEYFLRH